MTNEILDNEQLFNAITDKWKSAAQIREELGLAVGTKKIGQAYRKIRLDHREIETKMRGRMLLYRIPRADVPIAFTQEVTPELKPEPQIIQTEPPKNIAKELDNLIHELKAQGENVQEICYLALRDRKDKLDNELRYLAKNTPTVLDRIKSLQDALQREKNEKQDIKDRLDKLESKELVKRIGEERKVRQGVVTG